MRTYADGESILQSLKVLLIGIDHSEKISSNLIADCRQWLISSGRFTNPEKFTNGAPFFTNPIAYIDFTNKDEPQTSKLISDVISTEDGKTFCLKMNFYAVNLQSLTMRLENPQSVQATFELLDPKRYFV